MAQVTVPNESFEQEVQRVEDTQKYIRTRIDKCIAEMDVNRRTEIELNKQIWEETGSDITDMVGVADYWSLQGMINTNKRLNTQTQLELDRLSRSYVAPYFARFDFVADDSDERELIYVGVGSVVVEDTHEYLAYDWRAPICSIFYDSEMGPAAYRCPAGLIKGEVLLKRQFTLEDGELTGMFDSGLKIDDDILQKLLSRNTDEGMRTIVTSIQREQNTIIRHDAIRILAVYGPAGSGKTSVALHRLAYLMYHNRDTLQAEHILIISPNQLFGQYIASVLPELGEENIQAMTISEFAQDRLASFLQGRDDNDEPRVEVETLAAQMENGIVRRETDIKNTPEFREALTQYAIGLSQGDLIAEDICFEGETVVSREDIRRMYREEYQFLPPLKRMAKIRSRIEYLLRPLTDKLSLERRQFYLDDENTYTTGELMAMVHRDVDMAVAPLRQRLSSEIAPSALSLYRRFLQQQGLTINYRGAGEKRKGYISLADATALMYLIARLGGFETYPGVRHVFIDECQDYNTMQLEALFAAFPHASFTLVGDVNQSLTARLQGDITTAFPKDSTYEVRQLDRSYRSTGAIMTLAHRLLQREEGAYTFVRRQGEMPVYKPLQDPDAVYDVMTDFLEQCRERYPFAAIITGSSDHARRLHRELAARGLKVSLAEDGSTFIRGLTVMPITLAKGLEFDAVLIAPDLLARAGDEPGRRVLYTACTRALHRLWLVGLEGEVPPEANKCLTALTK